MPELFIITGSNGAGESTIGSTYLPEYIRNKVQNFDGDKLFLEKQKSLWKQGITAIKEARNIAYRFVNNTFDELVDYAILTNTDFVYEGHFINEATWEVPKRFMNNGYAIHILFLGLANTALSELRVIDRAKQGGHYVQPAGVAANFYGNLEKLDNYYPLFDTVTIIDTSEPEHTIVAVLEKGKLTYSVPAKNLPTWFTEGFPSIIKAFIK